MEQAPELARLAARLNKTRGPVKKVSSQWSVVSKKTRSAEPLTSYSAKELSVRVQEVDCQPDETTDH